MKKRIVVTGANGYIGRHVIQTLKTMGEDPVAVDIVKGKLPEDVEYILASVLDYDEDIYEKLGKPDACIHLAWRNGFNHKADTHMGDLSGHYWFLKNMIEGGLRDLTVMGSMHEIGYWEGKIDENTPANPMSMYGNAKNALRIATKALAAEKGVNLKWLRGYYILGDDLNNHSVFTKLLEKAEAGEKKFPFTSGKNKYDFIDVKELARQISYAAVQTEVTGEINCCSGTPVSLGEKAEMFIKEHGLDIKLDYGAFPDREYDSPEVWGDAEKIRRILNSAE